jgi:hypothetical protein
MSREIVKKFPIQEGPSVPWEFMAPHESQCQKNHGQSLKRIAERGGLGASEAWAVVNGIRYYEIKDEHAQKWFELAERVNREWSIERLLADEREACADRAYEYVQDMGQGLAIASGVREAVLNLTEKK